MTQVEQALQRLDHLIAWAATYTGDGCKPGEGPLADAVYADLDGFLGKARYDLWMARREVSAGMCTCDQDMAPACPSKGGGQCDTRHGVTMVEQVIAEKREMDAHMFLSDLKGGE